MNLETPIIAFTAKQRLKVICNFLIYDADGNLVSSQDTFFDVPKDDFVRLSLNAHIDD